MSRRHLLGAAGAGAAAVGLGPLSTIVPAGADPAAGGAAATLREGTQFVPGGDHALVGTTADTIRYAPGLKGFYVTDTGTALATGIRIPDGARLTEIQWVFQFDATSTGSAKVQLLDLSPTTDDAADTVFQQNVPGTGVRISIYGPTSSQSVTSAEAGGWLSMVTGTSVERTYRGMLVSWQPGAGGIVPVAPTRVYDSRTSGGKLVVDQDRIVPIVAGAGGVVVPVGASAVAITLTITGTEGGGGYVAAFAGDDAYAGTSSINWFGPNQNLATTVLVPVSGSRTIKLRAGVSRTDVVVDVTGYVI